MGEMQTSVTTEDLIAVIGTAACPRVVDVRRPEAFAAATEVLPGAVWRNHLDAESWGQWLDDAAGIVVYCVHGHQVSQSAAALLRSQGLGAHHLAGGIEAYREAGGVLVKASPGLQDREADSSHWVAASRAGFDSLVRIWFVRRFLDPAAQLHFVEPDWVDQVAAELGGRAVRPKLSEERHGDRLKDFFLCYSSPNEALQGLARIVETADADLPESRRQELGLSAMIEGLSHVFGDDRARVSAALPVFDALYAGCRRQASNGAASERS